MELISETERRLNDSRSRVQEERKVIARRKAIGADLIESQALLENLEIRVMLIEGPAALPPARAQSKTCTAASIASWAPTKKPLPTLT